MTEDHTLIQEAENVGRDQDAQRSSNSLIEQLSLGNRNPGIGTQHLFKNGYELLEKNRTRVYYLEADEKIEILAKSVKNNQDKVITILRKCMIIKLVLRINPSKISLVLY